MNNITAVKIAQGGWQVTHDGGQSTFVPTTHRFAADVQAWINAGNTPTPEVTLAEAQTAKKSELNADCKAAIEGGFPVTLSDGTTHTFTLTQTDQNNGLMSATAVQHILLTAQPWSAATTVTQSDVLVAGGEYYIATVGGTTGTTAPAWPTTFGTLVADGTVTWKLFGMLAGTTNGNIRVRVQDVVVVFRAGSLWVDAQRSKCDKLKAEVDSTQTVSGVQAITF